MKSLSTAPRCRYPVLLTCLGLTAWTTGCAPWGYEEEDFWRDRRDTICTWQDGCGWFDEGNDTLDDCMARDAYATSPYCDFDAKAARACLRAISKVDCDAFELPEICYYVCVREGDTDSALE